MEILKELLKMGLIDVGEVKIARASPHLGGVPGKERYVIYLPMSRAYLWRALHEFDEKVRLYIELPERVRVKLETGPKRQ